VHAHTHTHAPKHTHAQSTVDDATSQPARRHQRRKRCNRLQPACRRQNRVNILRWCSALRSDELQRARADGKRQQSTFLHTAIRIGKLQMCEVLATCQLTLTILQQDSSSRTKVLRVIISSSTMSTERMKLIIYHSLVNRTTRHALCRLM
jgi:hypothetical protein